jgi:orotidine-5'-phosphate decarboxylase
MNKSDLIAEIHSTQSYLCVGLDTDIAKLPKHFPATPESMLTFNRHMVEATADYCVAYKINTAFYEALGAEGWEVMRETLSYIPSNKFTIADAKRGDIGNTVEQYAKAFFEKMSFDSITVAPYMGADSVMPFLAYQDKWVILLGLTSNASSQDFQLLETEGGKTVFEQVIHKAQTWTDDTQMMFVVGATQTEYLQQIRKIAPKHFLLVPGVGSQGGSLAEVSEIGMNDGVGLLVNASRSILYASSGEDFAAKATQEAQRLQQEMAIYLQKNLKK